MVIQQFNNPTYHPQFIQTRFEPNSRPSIPPHTHATLILLQTVIVQFEDFETQKAVPLLARYKDTYRVFNDDIQGTGSVTLSGLLSAARNSGFELKDCKILCAGAGSAGRGVCT